MSEDGLRRRPSSASPVPPLEDDDLLAEILLRLPPRPSSLPSAAVVCKRWCLLVRDPYFIRRFRDHHRTPPLLGFFHGCTFLPTQEPPDRVPAARFSLNPDGAAGRRSSWTYLTCCRGLVLAWDQEEFLVLDPMAGLWRRIPYPVEQKGKWPCAAVVPPADGGRDRGLLCFRLVALFRDGRRSRFTRVYSSESGAWDHSVATLRSDSGSSPVLGVRPRGCVVGNAVYWMVHGAGKAMLEFDLDRQSLAIIQPPSDVNVGCDPMYLFRSTCQIIPAEGGRLVLVVLAGHSMQFWERETFHGSPAIWVLHKTIQSNNFLPLECSNPEIVGISAESNTIFVSTDGGVFMVQLKTMEYRKVLDEVKIWNIIPYSSF